MKEKDSIKKLFLFIIIITGLGVFVYHGSLKEIIFCDEIDTYTITNGNSIGFNFSDNTWIGNETINKVFRAEDGFQYNDVISTTAADVHPPIYYLFFKTVSVILEDFDLVWIGLITNLLFYIPFLILLYIFQIEYFHNCWLSLGTTLLIIFNCGVIGCALLIRMYMLKTLLLLSFLACTYYICDRMDGIKGYCLIGVITFLGFMTQYYFAIYVIFYSIAFCVYMMIKKNYSVIAKWLTAMFFAVLASTLFFPKWIRHVFVEYRGEQAIENLFCLDDLKDDLIASFKLSGKFLFGELWWLYWCFLIFVFIVVILIKPYDLVGRMTRFLLLSHGITSVVAQIFIAHIATSMESRYFWPTTIVQLINLFLMIQYIYGRFNCNKELFQGLSVACSLIVSFGLYNFSNTSIPYLGVDYKQGRIHMEAYSDIPWVYYGSQNYQMLCAAYDFLIPEKIMFVTDNMPEGDKIIERSDKFIIYVLNEDDMFTFVDWIESISNKDFEYEYLERRGMYCSAYLLTAN